MGRSCVLVLNWNGLSITRSCLRALLDAKVEPHDILLVDNGSTDGSPDALRKEFPELPQLCLATNTGYAAGNNAGLRLLLQEQAYEFVLVLNNDALVTPGMLSSLEDALHANDRLAIAQPKILWPDGTVENAGNTMDKFGVTHPRGRGSPGATPFPARGWFYPSGACMLVRLDALREVGLFDERYFCYHEDVDLAWRLRVAGWDHAYLDDVVCVHDESSTAGRSPKKIGVIWRNRWRTLLKDAPLRRIPAGMALTGAMAIGLSAKERDMSYLAMYARSLWWNVRHLADTLRERKRVQASRRTPDRELEPLFRPSVEWAMVQRKL